MRIFQPTISGSLNQLGSATISGSLNVLNGITGSLFGTSSWAENADTASYAVQALSASYVTSASYSVSASYVVSSSYSVSSSYALTASYVNTLLQDVVITGSLTATSFTGSLFGTASYSLQSLSSSYASTASYLNTLNQDLIFNGNLTLNGTASINYLNVVYESASVIYSSGSNQFGDNTNDTQTLIGTVKVSGSLQVNGNTQITGSLLVTQSYISTVDYIDFTVSPSPPVFNTGRLHWTDDTKTLQLDTDVNNFELEIGHQSVIRGRNTNSFTITKGTVVYINGESGNRPTFATASWEGDPSSATTIGIVAQDINTSQTGYAVTNGLIRGINTNAFAPGTSLYLSSSGQYSNTPAISPLHEVRLGKTITQAVDGIIYVDIQNGYEIGELHDVLVTSAAAGDLLTWNSGSLVWKNTKQLTGSYGLTGSLQATSFTGSLFGTSSWAVNAQTASYLNTLNQDLTFNGNLTLNGTASIAYLNVTYESASVIYSSGSNQFGNDTLDVQTLIGTVLISGSLNATGSVLISGNLIVNNVDYETTSASFETRILNNSSSIDLLSGSFLSTSSSFSTRIANLEFFSSSLDATFATDLELNTATASLSGSIAYLSGSYLASSSSFDTRILNNSSSISLLSGSFLNASSSLSTRVTNLENFSSSLDSTFATDAELNAATASLSGSIAYLSSSYLSSSASFETRILNNSSSIALLSGSFLSFSASYNTGSFTGSFIGELTGTSSFATNALSSSFTLTASYLNTLNQDLIFNGNLTLNGTASINYLNVVYESASVIYSSGSNQFGDTVEDVQTLIGAVQASGSLQLTGSLSIFGNTKLNGSLSIKTYRLIAASYTASVDDYRIGIQYTNTGTVSIQLPLISNVGQIEYKFKDEDGNSTTNPITIYASGSDLIDGVATAVLKRDYISIGLYNDGVSNWYIE